MNFSSHKNLFFDVRKKLFKIVGQFDQIKIKQQTMFRNFHRHFSSCAPKVQIVWPDKKALNTSHRNLIYANYFIGDWLGHIVDEICTIDSLHTCEKLGIKQALSHIYKYDIENRWFGHLPRFHITDVDFNVKVSVFNKSRMNKQYSSECCFIFRLSDMDNGEHKKWLEEEGYGAKESKIGTEMNSK